MMQDARPQDSALLDGAIHVATAGDVHIAAPFMAMAWTLSAQAPDRPIVLHVLDSGLKAATSAALQRLSDASGGRFQVRWLEVTSEVMASLPSVARYPKEAFMRLLLPSLLGDLDRVLWLDCDVLALANLAELWDTNLEGAPAAAAPEYGSQTVAAMVTETMVGSIVAPGRADLPGFNSGVMLLDLKQWREEGLGDRALALSCAHAREVKFADQDALNVVLSGRWHRLDLEWNVQLGALRSIPSVPAERIYAEVLERAPALLASPKILHFAGSKPWKSGLRSPYRKEYYNALRRSGFYGSSLAFRKARLSNTWQATLFFLTRRWNKLLGR